jgi:hypothetical protein
MYILKKYFFLFFNLFIFYPFYLSLHATQDWFPAGTEQMHAYGYKGEKRTALVIDSMFDLKHSVMKNNFKHIENLTPLSLNASNFNVKEYDPEHGTQVSSIIYQQAPLGKIMPLEVDYFLEHMSYEEEANKLFDQLFKYSFDAINLSWGLDESAYKNAYKLGHSADIDESIDNLLKFCELASKKNITVFIAAGNHNEKYDENISNQSDDYSRFIYKLIKLSNQPEHLGKIIIVGSSERALEDTNQGKVPTERIACYSGQCVNAKSFITASGTYVPAYDPFKNIFTRVSGTSFASPTVVANYLLLKEFFEKNGIQKSAQEIGKLMLMNARKNDKFYQPSCGSGFADMCFMDPFIKEILKKKQQQQTPSPQKIEKNYTEPFTQDIFKKIGGYEWKRYQGNAQQIKSEGGVLKIEYAPLRGWTRAELHLDPLKETVSTTVRVKTKGNSPSQFVIAEYDAVNKKFKGVVKSALLIGNGQIQETKLDFMRQAGKNYVIYFTQKDYKIAGFLEVYGLNFFENDNYTPSFTQDIFKKIGGYEWKRYQGNAQQIKSEGGVLKIEYGPLRGWTRTELHLDPLKETVSTTVRVKTKGNSPSQFVIAEYDAMNKKFKGVVKSALLIGNGQIQETKLDFMRQAGKNYVIYFTQKDYKIPGFLELNSLTIE